MAILYELSRWVILGVVRLGTTGGPNGNQSGPIGDQQN